MSNKDISICFFSHSSLLGGAERSMLDLMKILVKKGIKCSVVMQGDGVYKDTCLEHGMDVKSVDSIPWWCIADGEYEQHRKEIVDVYENNLYEIIEFVQTQKANLIYTQTIVNPFGAIVAEKLNLPHIWALREYGERDHNLNFLFGFKDSMDSMYKSSDFILSVSRSVAEVVLGENHENNDVYINYSAVDIPEVYKDKEIDIFGDDMIKIGIFGSVVDGKNQQDAILACSKLVEEGYKLKLYIVGAKEEKYYQKLLDIIKKLGRKDDIVFVDHTDEPIGIMNDMDIVLSCAVSEAMGRTLFEAILLKKPIIYSNVGGAKEVFKNGIHGLEYNLYDSDDLAKKIAYTIDDKVKRFKRVEEAYDYVTNKFTSKNYVKPLLNIIDKLKNGYRRDSGVYVTDFVLKSILYKNIEELNIRERSIVDIKKELKIKNDELEQKDNYIQEKRSAIEQKDIEILDKEEQLQQKDQQIHHLHTVAQSMRIKNRIKSVLPYKNMKNIVKVMKHIKDNPYLITKTLKYIQKNGIKSTLNKAKIKVLDSTSTVYISTPDDNLSHLPLVKTISQNNLKIAVVVHAFYIDILEDIISMINNIPNKPDLFVSISKDANLDEIKMVLKEHGYDNYTIVQVENRGRDVAPFLVDFSQNLLEYDVCCKIHGKKSLFTGSEQSNWRNHLYYNILGSKTIVNDILSAFEQDKKLGLIFSDSLGMLPYWGYTWLTNKGSIHKVLEKINLTKLITILEDEYICFPAGTMFWFRPQAIKQLLESDIRYDDFPKEPFPNDGTIAHAIERLFGYITRYNGYDFIELNQKEKLYTKNICHKNFNQLSDINLPHLKHLILDSEYIIFDIFDTLITRSIFYPDNLFRILEHKVDKKFHIKSNFFLLRKEYEGRIRKKLEYGTDLSYDDIYDTLYKSSLSEEVVDYLKKEEFIYEKEVLNKKEHMLEGFNFAKKHNKKIILLSDMYLLKKQIEIILKDLDIYITDVDIYVSSSIGKRKDNASVWSYLVDNNIIEINETLMIGDNEVSDCKIAGDMGLKHTYHIFSEKTSFWESPIGKNFKKKFSKTQEKDMILLGPTINTLFRSPFELSHTVLKFDKKLTPYKFGFIAFAPMMYLFMSHIYQKHQDKKIFFLARDGYFLRELYMHYLNSKSIESTFIPEYLYISRRTVLGAIKKDIENLKHIVYELGDFNGKFSDLIFHRMGIDKSFLIKCIIDDFVIVGKKDLDKAYKILIQYIDVVNEYSSKELKTFTNYLRSVGFMNDNKNVVIDLGFSGTIQNYLHKITNQIIEGEYFVTTNKVIKVENDNNILNGYFADKISIDDGEIKSIVFRYSLIFEAYLTSNEGQVLYFNDDMYPMFKDKVKDIGIQSKITEGIKGYFDKLSFIEYDFFDNNTNIKDISSFMFEYIMKNRLMDDELQSMFWIDDDFTGNGMLNILDILKDRGI